MTPLNFFKVLTLAGILVTSSMNGQIVINEYSASNLSGPTDNFGQREDWVELYNTTGAPINISGYYLSDKASNPTKWQIATASVPANGFLRIWCSGRGIATGTLHAGFKLTQTKPETIVFADGAGNIIDSITMRPAQANHSRGRTTDGAGTWSVFTTPSPNASNTNPQQEYATKPTMSVAPGFYPTAQTVTITSPDPNITIRYTTNGSEPTTTSTLYAGPVNVPATLVLRAKAFSSTATVPASFVETSSYFINSTHTIPVLSLFGNNLLTLLNGSQITAAAGMEYFDASGAFKTEAFGECNEHGNDSWAYNQRGVDFVTRDEYGYSYALLHTMFNTKPRAEFQRIILKAGANDNYPEESGGAHVRDAYVHVLSQLGKLHVDERSSMFAIVYVNGQYWGVYDYREKVDDSDFLDYYFNQDVPNIQYIKTWGGTWEEYGSPNALPAWNNLQNYVMANNMGLAANYNYVDSLYNLKSLADYFIIGSFSVCSDWLNWNTSWWRGLNPNGNHKKWRYTLWDLDATFGHYVNYTGIPSQNSNASPCDPNSLSDPGGQGHVPMLNKLLQESTTFRNYFLNRYVDLVNTTFSCSYSIQVLDSMVQVIQPEMTRHCQKWGGSVAGWTSNVNALRTFIQQRCAQLAALFTDPDCAPWFGNVSGPYDIVVNVDPPLSGLVDLNSLNLLTYTWSGTYLGGVPITLEASPNTGYAFDYWEVFNSLNVIVADSADTLVTINLAADDSIVAHFTLTGPPPPPPPPPPGPITAFVIPTAFSPNGDANNDLFLVLGGDVDEFDLTIFNRWGEQIFHTTDQSQGWDGKFKGQDVNTGVYAYQLKVKFGSGEQQVKGGNIALMR